MREVQQQFEEYAAKHYLAALSAPHADESIRYAGLRYLITRRVQGFEPALREIFTSPVGGEFGRSINRACLDALLLTTEDASETARYLVEIAVRSPPLPTTKLCPEGLDRLGPVADDALLSELNNETRPGTRLKLAGLLQETSGIASPRPMPFWKKSPPEERGVAIGLWRAALLAEGRSPPPEPAEEDDSMR